LNKTDNTFERLHSNDNPTISHSENNLEPLDSPTSASNLVKK